MKKLRADPVLLLMVGILLVFSLIMMVSLGTHRTIEIWYKDILYPNCNDPSINCYKLLWQHFQHIVEGIIVFIVAAKIPYQFWKKIAFPLFAILVFVLILVFIIGKANGTFAKSWLVFFNTSLQPVEFAKLGLIVYLARWMESKGKSIETFQNGFLPFCVVTGMMVLPVAFQPDLGGALIMGGIAVAMFFAAGAKVRHLFLGAAIAGAIALLIIYSLSGVFSSLSHVRDRFESFFSGGGKNCKTCWQSEQANIAVGSGGFWGKGLTQGVQKTGWLPQSTDDFEFAAIAEELGFIRIFLLVIVYAVIGYRGFKIAEGAPNRFTMLTAVGITAWIMVGAFINIAVNLDLMPVTGVTLPFVSYGGSSLLALMIGTGILVYISKYSSTYAPSFERRGNRRTHHAEYRPYSRA